MPQKKYTSTPSERKAIRDGTSPHWPMFVLLGGLLTMCLTCGLIGILIEDKAVEVSKTLTEQIEELEAENDKLEEGVERMHSRGETNSVSYDLTTRRLLQNSLEIRDLRKERGY